MTAGDPASPAEGSTARSWLLPVAALFPLAAILIFLQQGQSAWALRLGDSDNYMRLVQVRDLLAGQGWFDLVLHRVNPPEGLHTHWSRLADLPYAIPILLLRPLLGVELAERVTIVVVPPLLLLLTMIAMSRLANRLAGWRGSVCACLLLAVSAPILAQFVPGRVDHHGLQILLLVAAVSSAMGANRIGSGAAAAAASAASLAIGLETAPYLVLIAAWIGGLWLAHGNGALAKARGYFLGLAVMVPLFLVMTVPVAEWLVVRPDALSGGQVVIILVGSLAFVAGMSILGADRLLTRTAVAGAATTITLAVAAQFPGLWSAPYSDVDPLMTRLWIEMLAETRSFSDYWRESPMRAVAGIWFIIAAGVTALIMTGISRGSRRDNFILLALLTAMGILLSLWQVRGDAAATSMAVAVAAAVLALLWESWQRGKSSILPLAAAAVLLNPISVRAAMTIAEESLERGDVATVNKVAQRSRCDSPAGFIPLAQQPRGLILNPIDQSATLLARTRHSVIAAANHRNAAANASVYRAFTADPRSAAAMVRRLRADYLVFCLDAPETVKLVSFAPNGLLAQLRSGRVPTWLERVTTDRRHRLVVYKVRTSNAAVPPASPAAD